MTAPNREREQAIEREIQQHPHLFLRLAENSLTVAESFRDNYFRNTARLVATLRKGMDAARRGRHDPVLGVQQVDDTGWPALQGEVVTFIDGGVGQVRVSSQVPILLRVGSYTVKTGERRLAERERFGYYPVILGDLEGGSRERKDFVDIVRVTAELLGGLSILTRTPDLRVLMFHGPLVYLVGSYAGHAPFTEADIDLFLRQYGPHDAAGRALKEEFLHQASIDIYPQMASDRSDELARRRLFEPLAWMAFLYRKLVETARQRSPVPIISGVVERGDLSEFIERVLFDRVFRGLRAKGNADYFNQMYGRTELVSPRAVIERLGYTDALLLGMLLQPGQRSESWSVAKYDSLHQGNIRLPGEPFETRVTWQALRPDSRFGFPRVEACYVAVSETTAPIRVGVFSDLGTDQIDDAARRAYLYARMLPHYGFPVGLDVVDRFAHVPAWLTDAYGKLIRYHLGVSLQQGAIQDDEMRRILVQAIYMTHRDWLFRPTQAEGPNG